MNRVMKMAAALLIVVLCLSTGGAIGFVTYYQVFDQDSGQSTVAQAQTAASTYALSTFAQPAEVEEVAGARAAKANFDLPVLEGSGLVTTPSLLAFQFVAKGSNVAVAAPGWVTNGRVTDSLADGSYTLTIYQPGADQTCASGNGYCLAIKQVMISNGQISLRNSDMSVAPEQRFLTVKKAGQASAIPTGNLNKVVVADGQLTALEAETAQAITSPEAAASMAAVYGFSGLTCVDGGVYALQSSDQVAWLDADGTTVHYRTPNPGETSEVFTCSVAGEDGVVIRIVKDCGNAIIGQQPSPTPVPGGEGGEVPSPTPVTQTPEVPTSTPGQEVTPTPGTPMVTPTEVPTETPTEIPTNTPTEVPTQTPTEVPTNTPTDVPTSTPTDIPTNTPTEVPTNTPTATWTPTETEVPTNTPTSIPTNTPTEVPTNTPTEVPTKTPTQVPTETPTEIPTHTPTEVPTNTPTEVPTQTPTDVPTSTPTRVPTNTPTEVPTSTPTDIPTNTPTEVPTNTPTATPKPTKTPTPVTPTQTPRPTKTPWPTKTPTQVPPTKTPWPTKTPKPPTMTPTEAVCVPCQPETPVPTPTMYPTNVPSPTPDNPERDNDGDHGKDDWKEGGKKLNGNLEQSSNEVITQATQPAVDADDTSAATGNDVTDDLVTEEPTVEDGVWLEPTVEASDPPAESTTDTSNEEVVEQPEVADESADTVPADTSVSSEPMVTDETEDGSEVVDSSGQEQFVDSSQQGDQEPVAADTSNEEVTETEPMPVIESTEPAPSEDQAESSNSPALVPIISAVVIVLGAGLFNLLRRQTSRGRR